jgi:hypothetical protein
MGKMAALTNARAKRWALEPNAAQPPPWMSTMEQWLALTCCSLKLVVQIYLNQAVGNN